MSDTSWVLKDVDPDVRAQAAEEAARLGMSLSDYLAEALLRTALLDGVAGAEAEADALDVIPPPERATPPVAEPAFSPRHRIEAIERRLGLAVGGFESATAALDSSLVELGGRMDETEALAAGAAEGLNTLVQEVGVNLIALRKRLADAEDATEVLGESHEGAYEMFAARCDRVDERLQDLDGVTAELSQSHDALKHAVADDFSALAQESSDRLSAGLSEVRAAADAAAAHADAAVAHLVNELRGLREQVEQRMAANAAETRARVLAVFGEADERINGLADRVTLSERAADQLRIQIADVEDGAQTALEETADTLRQAGAALAAEFARATQDNRVALESVHADLSSELSGLRERQAGEGARIKLLDAAVGNTASEISAVRQLVGSAMGDISAVRDGLSEVEASIAAVYENCDARLSEAEAVNRASVSQLHAELNTRFAAMAVHDDERQRHTDESLAAVRLETERIEACTLAALEQLNTNFSAGDAALDAKLEARLARAQHATDALISDMSQRLEAQFGNAQQSADAHIDEVAQRLDGQIGELRDSHANAVAHLKLIDRTLGSQNIDSAIEAAVSPIKQQLERIESELGYRPLDRMISTRLDELEANASGAEIEQALAMLKIQVDAMALQVGSMRIDEAVAQRVEEMRTRLSGVEGKVSETADRMQGVARLLGRATAQTADAGKQSEERLHKIEMSLADLRLETIRAQKAGPTAMDAVAEIARRMAEFEEQQAETLKVLQSEIAQFIGESDGRFAQLENGADGRDAGLGKAFESLRVSVEERILGIELRSVRTLEQVADTVSMLEERLTGAETLPDAAQKAG